jgi:hypothetical protein
MSARCSSNTRVRAIFAALLLVVAGSALAAEPATNAPSKEMREKMAAVHQKMADCLRSDKAVAECHSEMQKSCTTMMGEEGCPMMGQMMGTGMKNRMRQGNPDAK